MKSAVLAVALALPAWSQTGGISGPVMGLLPGNGVLRTIIGIPGAATLGSSVPLEFPVAQTAVSRDYALVVKQEDGVVLRVWADGHSAALEGVSVAPDRIVLSAAGSAAGLYYAASRSLVMVSGLPDSPAAKTLDLASLPSEPVLVAVSDAGSALAVAAGSLYLADAGSTRPVAAVGEVAALGWAGSDAVLARPGELIILSDIAGEPKLRTVPVGEEITHPVAVTFSNGRFVVADSAGSLILIDAAGSSSSLSCACAIPGLEPLNGQGLFRLTSADAKPLWLLDTGGTDPKLWFVPVGEEVRQ